MGDGRDDTNDRLETLLERGRQLREQSQKLIDDAEVARDHATRLLHERADLLHWLRTTLKTGPTAPPGRPPQAPPGDPGKP
jgi:hypothetical protein